MTVENIYCSIMCKFPISSISFLPQKTTEKRCIKCYVHGGCIERTRLQIVFWKRKKFRDTCCSSCTRCSATRGPLPALFLTLYNQVLCTQWLHWAHSRLGNCHKPHSGIKDQYTSSLLTKNHCSSLLFSLSFSITIIIGKIITSIISLDKFGIFIKILVCNHKWK